MKITIVCDVLGEENNGTTLAACNLIRHLQAAGHDVRVVSPDPATKGKPGYFVVPPLNMGHLVSAILHWNGVELAHADKKILREAIEGADVVHLLLPFGLSQGALKIVKKENIPVTASFHCQAENITAHIGAMNNPPVNRTVYRFFYEKVYRHVDMIHFPTAFIRDEFFRSIRKTLPATVISNGVNDRFFRPAEGVRVSDKFTIVCTGRYSTEKSQQTLLYAVGRSPYRDRIHLVFAGDGPKKHKLRRLAKKLGVEAEFRFFDRETLVSVLRGADLYVHTAVIEIEAIACLEAIVCGLLPVICNSKRSATRNFALDPRCLYRKADARDLSEKIGYFIEHPEEAAALRAKYADFSAQFRQEDCMNRMEQMLLDAAKRS